MTNNIFALALIIPFCWLLFYGLLLITRVRVGEAIPVAGLKIVSGSLFFFYSYLIYYGEATFSWPHWIAIPGTYEFPISLIFNRQFGFAGIVMLVLLSVITKYSESYLHKEKGFHRFFFLMSVFLTAFPLVIYGDNIDVIFIGWEIIGITSVLLIGFYETREHAIVNSWWALGTYRLCDVGLLAATTLGHYAVHTTNVHELNATGALLAHHGDHRIMLAFVAGCIVFASLGKAAQLPMISWITRAMEGPTPSSALYYGALSVGLGPLLLLKFQGLILYYPLVQAAVIAIGALTAMYAYVVSKTRSDAKSILALSAVFEVSIMVIEVGIGLHDWVIFHFVANAFMRVFQFLRSMNAIHDFYDNPLFYRGAPHRQAPWFLRKLPKKLQRKIYYQAMNGFGLDNFILNQLIFPWLSFWSKINRLENRLALGEKNHQHVSHTRPEPAE